LAVRVYVGQRVNMERTKMRAAIIAKRGPSSRSIIIAMARVIAIIGTPMPTQAPMAAFVAVLRPEEAI